MADLIYSNGKYYVGNATDSAYQITIPVEHSNCFKVSIPNGDDTPETFLDNPTVSAKIKQIPVITLSFKQDDISYSVNLDVDQIYLVNYVLDDGSIAQVIGKWLSYEVLKEFVNSSFNEYFMLTFDCSEEFTSIIAKIDSRKIRYISILEEVEDTPVDDEIGDDEPNREVDDDLDNTVDEEFGDDTTSEEVNDENTTDNENTGDDTGDNTVEDLDNTDNESTGDDTTPEDVNDENTTDNENTGDNTIDDLDENTGDNESTGDDTTSNNNTPVQDGDDQEVDEL